MFPFHPRRHGQGNGGQKDSKFQTYGTSPKTPRSPQPPSAYLLQNTSDVLIPREPSLQDVIRPFLPRQRVHASAGLEVELPVLSTPIRGTHSQRCPSIHSDDSGIEGSGVEHRYHPESRDKDSDSDQANSPHASYLDGTSASLNEVPDLHNETITEHCRSSHMLMQVPSMQQDDIVLSDNGYLNSDHLISEFKSGDRESLITSDQALIWGNLSEDEDIPFEMHVSPIFHGIHTQHTNSCVSSEHTPKLIKLQNPVQNRHKKTAFRNNLENRSRTNNLNTSVQNRLRRAETLRQPTSHELSNDQENCTNVSSNSAESHMSTPRTERHHHKEKLPLIQPDQVLYALWLVTSVRHGRLQQEVTELKTVTNTLTTAVLQQQKTIGTLHQILKILCTQLQKQKQSSHYPTTHHNHHSATSNSTESQKSNRAACIATVNVMLVFGICLYVLNTQWMKQKLKQWLQMLKTTVIFNSLLVYRYMAEVPTNLITRFTHIGSRVWKPSTRTQRR